MADLALNRDKTAVISGIGCSSRFPYYMETYGMHSIHGRAPAVASGLRIANRDIDVWVVTGDGDGLSIGGNHMLHLLRRNFNLQLLLFNNQIYGLTKGQYSPTSELNKKTKSTPMGSIDRPLSPCAFAMGCDATFIARSLDRDPTHLKDMLHRSHAHRGTAFLEIYQNCNIFNDGAFFTYTEKDSKPDSCLFVEHGKPLVFGSDRSKGIMLKDMTPSIVDLTQDGVSESDLWIHDETDIFKATMLTRFFQDQSKEGALPRPFGVLYAIERPCYEDMLFAQIETAVADKGNGDLDKLIAGTRTWTIS